MTMSILNPDDPLERQHEKLVQIVDVLMRRVEQDTDDSGAAYAQFQRAVLLEDQVRERTGELERALDLLNASNAMLAEAKREAEGARRDLANAIETVQEGFAIFDAGETLVMCNSRFCAQMPDVRAHLDPGLAFADYVTMVSRSAHLARPPGESAEDWAVRRMRRHADNHVMFNVRLGGDRWIQVSEHRTREGGTVVLQTDVTDIIRLEREERGKLLDDQARMIRATLDHISQGVCIFDHQRRLAGWNRRLVELLDVPARLVRLGTTFDAFTQSFGRGLKLSGELTTEGLNAWAGSATARAPIGFEVGDGRRVLAAFGQEMPGRGFVISFTDVTRERDAVREARETNETLEQRVRDRTNALAEALASAERANASRSRFVAAASHDLLQPLSAAKLYLEALGSEDLAPAAQDTLERAGKALSSVEAILDALLDISRLEAGPAAVNVRPVDLGALLERLREEFKPVAERKGLTLRIAPHAATVASDATYLRRILQNLIANAIRYTEAGTVQVLAERCGDALKLSVTDTGQGIAKRDLQAIFREFHRLNARASAADGMGLGLAIVERACALLNHPLAVQSTLGAGSSFMLSLPIIDSSARRFEDPVDASRPTTPMPTDKIVGLVENDRDLRSALCTLLEKWGLSVIEADTGEEMLSLLDEIGIVPEVFLVDYQLGPGMDGIAVLKTLQDRYGPVDGRLLTAEHSAKAGRAFAKAGVDVFYKPIDPNALADYLLSLA
ncbi:MAG: PAS-domain containing protein [Paracoccaceae bacterium]